jgi:hypothetical protein
MFGPPPTYADWRAPIYPFFYWCRCDVKWRDLKPESTCWACGRECTQHRGGLEPPDWRTLAGSQHRHMPEGGGSEPYTETL